jgi:uncharacterized protein DUF11
VTDLLPGTLDPVSITASGLGTCTLLPTPSCTFLALPAGGSRTVTLTGSPTESGIVVNKASATSDSLDTDTSNNSQGSRL